jgi:DNA-binding transcriptional ArsR family regulator
MTDPRGKKNARSHLATAMSHPTRSKIVRALLETPQSATGIAESLGLPKSTVSEELRRLKADGLIEEVSQRNRRGAVERMFSATRAGRLVGPEEWKGLRTSEKRSLILGTIQALRQWLSSALAWNSGDFSSDSYWVANIHTVDERGWSELVTMHQRALEESERIVAESAARLANGSDPARRGCSAFILFEMPDQDEEEEGQTR